MKILLVEDDVDSIAVFADSVKVFEKQFSVVIETVIATNKNEAIEKLERDFDGAIIDLRLSVKGSGEGNAVINKIHEKYRIPIAVHTGTPGELERGDLSYIGVFIRGESSYSDILGHLLKIYRTGLTRILGGRGVLEEALDKIFWTYLPEAISHWISSDLEPEIKEKQLLRYSLSHIQEILSVAVDGAHETRNSAEVYIWPPIKNPVAEGMIVEDRASHEFFIILTPACDISQGKAEYIQMAKISNLLREESVVSKTTAQARESSIGNYVGNRKGGRYHFLPPFKELPPGIIDFQCISSCLALEFVDKFNPICCISSPFYKDIVERFSANYSRQGSPDFDNAEMSQQIASSLEMENPIGGQ